MEAAIVENGGTLDETQAISLLAEVGVVSGDVDKLQWSAVYNLSTLEGTLFAQRNTENQIHFQLGS